MVMPVGEEWERILEETAQEAAERATNRSESPRFSAAATSALLDIVKTRRRAGLEAEITDEQLDGARANITVIVKEAQNLALSRGLEEVDDALVIEAFWKLCPIFPFC
jgi:hypothetical protein